MNIKGKGVLVIGSANMDLVFFTDRFPRPGETVLGNQFEMIPGGKGANQAVCSARLGSPTTFIGKMGNDEFHEILSASMQNDQINLAYLKTDPMLKTGTALIMVDGEAENEIVVISGSNLNLSEEDVVSADRAFKEAAIIVTQLEIPTETVLAAARMTRKYNKLFLLNPAPGRKLPEELYKLTDFITPNETELESLTGLRARNQQEMIDGAEKLVEWGVRHVIVTMGAQGVLWVTEKGYQLFPAEKVSAVDTTAAGDAFNGAFASSLSNGEPIEQAIKFAILVAAISVTRKGAQSSLPQREEMYKNRWHNEH